MNTVYKISLTLIIIGALNWGMVGLFDINLVTLLFGKESVLSNIVYAIIGICGLICTALLLKPLDDDVHHN